MAGSIPTTLAARKQRLAEVLEAVGKLATEATELSRLIADEERIANVEISEHADYHVSTPPAEIPTVDAKPRPDMMRLADVLKKTGKTKRTIYRWMDEPDMLFPRPEIFRGVALWNPHDVEGWWADHQSHLGRWPG